MKKLEIKHLAAYLLYGLKMVNTKSGRIIDVRGLRDTVSTFYIEAIVKKGNTFEEADYQADIWPFKPLLIPLSELTNPIFDGVSPMTVIAFEYFGFGEGYVSEPEFKPINQNCFIGFQNDYQGIYFVREETIYGMDTSFRFEQKSNGVWIPQKVTCQLEMFDFLFEHHFDVFGLIESGLALNKLEYTNH